VQEAHQVVAQGDAAHGLHGDHVVVGANEVRSKMGSQLELGGGHLVVAGLGGDAQGATVRGPGPSCRPGCAHGWRRNNGLPAPARGRARRRRGCVPSDEVGPQFVIARSMRKYSCSGPRVVNTRFTSCCRRCAAGARPGWTGPRWSAAGASCGPAPRRCSSRKRSGWSRSRR
jgi:hypothetical protein